MLHADNQILAPKVEKQAIQEIVDIIKDNCISLINAYDQSFKKMKEKNEIRRPKTVKRVANNDELKGGKFVKFDSQNFDIIVNILIGIRKSLTNLTIIPGTYLNEYEFTKKLSCQNDWIRQGNNERANVTDFKFYDYAPLVFNRIRPLSGISEEDYQRSLGAEQILSCFFSNNFETLYELCSSG